MSAAATIGLLLAVLLGVGIVALLITQFCGEMLALWKGEDW